jgi:uncharacterized protein (UPF0335 family)
VNQSADHLRQLVDRVLRLKEEQDALSADIRDIYAEARANGFDKSAMGALVTHLRRRTKDADKEDARESIFALYLETYTNGASLTHTHARERVPPPARACEEPEDTTDAAPDLARAAIHDGAFA